jgi:undecaprenyl diphosphate synthase
MTDTSSATPGEPARLLVVDDTIDAARRAAEDVAAGRIRRVDERTLAARLDDPQMLDVDLLIRTSGEQRVSNFLLWQAAYAELVFTDVLWPDFDADELARCIAVFQARDRRYGGAEDRPVTSSDADVGGGIDGGGNDGGATA